jgi:glyoxylase-like metal-dependent hydrolase (beta-lactamase superfamily II)
MAMPSPLIVDAMSWRIGRCTVTRVPEQESFGKMSLPEFFPDFVASGAERHLAKLSEYYRVDDLKLWLSNHSWLIQTDSHVIVVDTCSGNGRHRPYPTRFHQLNTRYHELFCSTGVRPEDVDIVLNTHLHSDHVGWNTMSKDDAWVPTFSNATYMFSRAEHEYWLNLVTGAWADDERRAFYYDSIAPCIQSGQVKILDGGHYIDDQAVIEPAAGHTPGHMLLKLASGQDIGVFCGDVFQHPLQMFEPDINAFLCMNPERARRTRREVLAYCADHSAHVFGINIGAPYVFSVSRSGDTFVPVPSTLS